MGCLEILKYQDDHIALLEPIQGLYLNADNGSDYREKDSLNRYKGCI